MGAIPTPRSFIIAENYVPSHEKKPCHNKAAVSRDRVLPFPVAAVAAVASASPQYPSNDLTLRLSYEALDVKIARDFVSPS